MKTPNRIHDSRPNEFNAPETREAQAVETKPVETKRDSTSDAKDDINKQIADHEKWMGNHSDDARGVQERLQQIAVLQQKLVELDAPKPEQRVRQTQTV